MFIQLSIVFILFQFTAIHIGVGLIEMFVFLLCFWCFIMFIFNSVTFLYPCMYYGVALCLIFREMFYSCVCQL